MQSGKLIHGESLILCLCEGTAELTIMEMLLENELLVFKKEDLIHRKLHRRSSVREVEERYLSYDYDKEVFILRIIDSKKERFQLSRAYQGRFEIETCYTRPEIEILIIIANGDYDEYSKKYKTKQSPSAYCKMKYKCKDVKSEAYVRAVFSDVGILVRALKAYRSYSANESTIADLLKTDHD